MNQLFLQLAQTVTGNVITIVALETVAAIIGFVVAWFYAKSVYTPKIRGLEADTAGLNVQVAGLTNEYGILKDKIAGMNEKIAILETEALDKENEIKNLSSGNEHVGKFVIGKSKNGGEYFNLKATNGQTILTSPVYPDMAECIKAIGSVREYCRDDNMFDRKISSNNKHYFSLKTPEGVIIGKSELYESMANMEKGIASVKRNGISMTVVEEQTE
jgi:uncharacterized protein